MVADQDIPIIYPPPEVKNIVDKTAGFVARNGVEFETRIKQVKLKNLNVAGLQCSTFVAYTQVKRD